MVASWLEKALTKLDGAVAPKFLLAAPGRYDPIVKGGSRGRDRPGVRKAGALSLVRRKSVSLLSSSDYRWRELFEAADVMSEGATRDEPDGPVYYGSTSVLLPRVSRGGLVPDAELEFLRHAVALDPHARVRAVRIACLEAQLRAPGALGRVRAEFVVRDDPRGIRIDVDVEARVYEESARRLELGESSPRAERRRRGSR
jgi:hypothetical protein